MARRLIEIQAEANFNSNDESDEESQSPRQQLDLSMQVPLTQLVPSQICQQSFTPRQRFLQGDHDEELKMYNEERIDWHCNIIYVLTEVLDTIYLTNTNQIVEAGLHHNFQTLIKFLKSSHTGSQIESSKLSNESREMKKVKLSEMSELRIKSFKRSSNQVEWTSHGKSLAFQCLSEIKKFEVENQKWTKLSTSIMSSKRHSEETYLMAEDKLAQIRD